MKAKIVEIDHEKIFPHFLRLSRKKNFSLPCPKKFPKSRGKKFDKLQFIKPPCGSNEPQKFVKKLCTNKPGGRERGGEGVDQK